MGDNVGVVSETFCGIVVGEDIISVFIPPNPLTVITGVGVDDGVTFFVGFGVGVSCVCLAIFFGDGFISAIFDVEFFAGAALCRANTIVAVVKKIPRVIKASRAIGSLL